MTTPEELRGLLEEMKETQKETQRQLARLQRDVAAGQSQATKKVVQKLEEEKTAVFKKKGNEVQFRFNKLLDNRFKNALEELGKIPASEEEPEVSAAVTAARVELTEGRVDIANRQKRIKIADRSEYGWMTVELYEHDELASDSADEKKLEKAEKEAEKRVTKRKRDKMNKRTKKREASSPERRRWPVDPQQHTSRRPQFQMPPRAGMTRLIGPCYRCGEMGHLVATCPQTRPSNWYPFEGNVGRGINDGMCEYKIALKTIPSDHGQLEVTHDLLDDQRETMQPGLNGWSDQDKLEALQGWEGEEKGEILGRGSEVEQITRVKGRLEQSLQFWKEVLQASPFVISCIEEGYKLPLLLNHLNTGMLIKGQQKSMKDLLQKQ